MQKKIYSVDSKFEAEISTSEKIKGGFIYSCPYKLPYNIDINHQNQANNFNFNFSKNDFDPTLNSNINLDK
jgi:hypothetical protein